MLVVIKNWKVKHMIKFVRKINLSPLNSRIIQKFQIMIIISSLLTLSIFQTACNSKGQNIDEEKEVMAALDKFLRAFENGDFETMEASMTDDAYIFPRAIMSNDSLEPIDNANYRRINGLDPQMKQVINSLHESGKQQPYMKLEPKDLKITMLKDAAIVTFHLENGKSLSRRTLVLSKYDGIWKIIHLHPSNVVSSE
jgi:ketosteroid isomerase-like protein